jgi:mRNA interferase HigB
MRVIARKTLYEFWSKHQDAKAQLEAWFAEAKHAKWKSPADVKKQYAQASIIGNNRVVFNICGNKYRLVVHVKYEFETVLIRFIGRHADYNRINAEEI